MSLAESSEDGSGQPGEQRGTKRKISLSSCGVCGSDEAKYRCPGCSTQSCSLLCVKKHKKDSGCSGVRNKTAFVTLSRFDEMALLSDYRFLEDAGRFADGSARDQLLQPPHNTFKAKKLIASARKMNITLQVLPATFTRSRENSTIFLMKEKRFLWHLKLTFPQSGAEFTQRRVCDRLTLEQILTTYIHPTESDPVKRQKLKMYAYAAFDDVKVFMKVEGGKANCVRYQELELAKSLRENLSYKIVIEYPVLHVVLRDHWKEYQLQTPARPAAACGRLANTDAARGKSDIQPPPWRPCSPAAVSVRTRSQETLPACEQLKGKRTAEEELEEGEISDSSDAEEGGNNGERSDEMESHSNLDERDVAGTSDGGEHQRGNENVSDSAGRENAEKDPDDQSAADVGQEPE